MEQVHPYSVSVQKDHNFVLVQQYSNFALVQQDPNFVLIQKDTNSVFRIEDHNSVLKHRKKIQCIDKTDSLTTVSFAEHGKQPHSVTIKIALP